MAWTFFLIIRFGNTQGWGFQFLQLWCPLNTSLQPSKRGSVSSGGTAGSCSRRRVSPTALSACRSPRCLPTTLLPLPATVSCRSPQEPIPVPSLARAGVPCFLAPFRSYQSPYSPNTAVPAFSTVSVPRLSPTPMSLWQRIQVPEQCAWPQRGTKLLGPPPPSLGKWGQVFKKLEGQALSVTTVTVIDSPVRKAQG